MPFMQVALSILNPSAGSPWFVGCPSYGISFS